MLRTLTREDAGRFAERALANIAQEYPHKLDHVLTGDGDAVAPRLLHPAFHASYDWHSCVHMHWLLVHVRRLFPDLPQAVRIDAVCDAHFAPGAIAGECAYLQRPDAGTFERTYGWAWLLKLSAELALCSDARARRWSESLAPLAAAMEARYLAFLPRSDYPIRYGMHTNSAFGLLFALDFATHGRRPALREACVAKARAWYAEDADAPAGWEPSGADFLSPALVEAALMACVLDPAQFGAWLGRFLPGLAGGAPATLLAPVRVADRTDAQIVHLDGLNLSRAWCMRSIAAAVPRHDPRRRVLAQAAVLHFDAGLAALASDAFVGSHWLASFAALALSAGMASARPPAR